ncbi:hypothetical protein, partial [Variovorax sp. WS11]|uniref:hypothetical protein n=1 Tax=Variovorax sp. WS11 TaxID=1105204 RepID=UPI001C62D886
MTATAASAGTTVSARDAVAKTPAAAAAVGPTVGAVDARRTARPEIRSSAIAANQSHATGAIVEQAAAAIAPNGRRSASATIAAHPPASATGAIGAVGATTATDRSVVDDDHVVQVGRGSGGNEHRTTRAQAAASRNCV